jgi:broad specificity polyphosphatase/5'/3'-nucleotidase SurE
MRILIANDDGIYSPGIATLAEVASKFGDVLVVAPDVEQSSAWTRQSVRHYDGKVVPGEDPLGRKLFWFTVVPIEGTDEATDRWAVEHSYVSMTPLRLDLTNEKELACAQLRHPLG